MTIIATTSPVIIQLQQQNLLLQQQLNQLQTQNQNQIQQTQSIQNSLNQVIQNTTPVISLPPAVTLTVSAPNKSGESITIKSNESATINIIVGNPSSNNLNPGYTCSKSGDWQGQVAPVDHTEGSTQDNNLNFSNFIGVKTFTISCSNSAGITSDSVTVNVTDPFPNPVEIVSPDNTITINNYFFTNPTPGSNKIIASYKFSRSILGQSTIDELTIKINDNSVFTNPRVANKLSNDYGNGPGNGDGTYTFSNLSIGISGVTGQIVNIYADISSNAIFGPAPAITIISAKVNTGGKYDIINNLPLNSADITISQQ